ncbi:uncharacterized protein LOC143855759 [Tasmannia lanceolata]|uniref:uncharacterized protein LOC143855759 n=1 Tax=Tasmannia lanceolata TaxID=3420 RepID=UPI0040647F08
MDRLWFLHLNDTRCLLCHANPENVNHLFFSCSYSSWVWSTILRHSSIRRKPKKLLSDEEKWIRNNSSGDYQSSIGIKLDFSTTINHLWKERNDRIHGNQPNHETQILHQIVFAIGSRLRSLGLHARDRKRLLSDPLLPTLTAPVSLPSSDPFNANG